MPRRAFAGVLLLVLGIAAFIEAHDHRPLCPHGGPICEGHSHGKHGHLSRTAYDVLRIGAWGLVIVGGLLLVLGVIQYVTEVRRPPAPPRP